MGREGGQDARPRRGAGRNAAARALRRLVLSVVALLAAFFGMLTWRALTWTPRFFVRLGGGVARAAPPEPAPPPYWAAGPRTAGVAAGRALYYQRGCVTCHGLEGRGGVRNPNARTHEEIPALIYVKDSYKEEWLARKINEGVARIDRLDPAKPAPPMRMPAWRGTFTDAELHDLALYLFSLYPGHAADEDDR